MVQDGLQDDPQRVPTFCKMFEAPKWPKMSPERAGMAQAGLLGSSVHVHIDVHVHHRSKLSTVDRCKLQPDWSRTSSKEMHDVTPAFVFLEAWQQAFWRHDTNSFWRPGNKPGLEISRIPFWRSGNQPFWGPGNQPFCRPGMKPRPGRNLFGALVKLDSWSNRLVGFSPTLRGFSPMF